MPSGGSKRKLGTKCAQAGRPAGRSDGPISVPIVQSATYRFESVRGVEEYNRDPSTGYLYSRYENPTVRLAEQALASLEGAGEAVLFSSGMAAISTLLATWLKKGDHALAMRSVYGGTYRFLRENLPGAGVDVDFLEMKEIARFEEKLRPSTRVLYLETPTNPTLEVVDLAVLARRARSKGVLTVVDSTFGTPLGQRPLELGCDAVMHSVSKYLSGHADVIGGVLAGSAERMAPVREQLKVWGGCADPFAAWLMLRGLKTLHLRMEAHERNAFAVAQALEGHAAVRRVFYPGLSSHPAHETARRQMSNFGGMVCFDLGSFEAARRAMDAFEVIERAASLGGVESVASLPVLTSHTGYSDEELARAGVGRGMIRLSVGVEDTEDLIEDLERGLYAAGAPADGSA